MRERWQGTTGGARKLQEAPSPPTGPGHTQRDPNAERGESRGSVRWG